MTVLPRTPAKRGDQRVQLLMDWAGFEQFLALRGESAATRIT
jgi:hypothetical protein